MEEKENYEINYEALFEELFSPIKKQFDELLTFGRIVDELSSPDAFDSLSSALENFTKMSFDDRVNLLKQISLVIRVSKQLCEKYNIDISEDVTKHETNDSE